MTLRKVLVENSVKHIPQNEQTQERDSKPNTININSLPRKQNKKLSQKKEKLIQKHKQRVLKLLNDEMLRLIKNKQIR